jgi:type I restriction enzyme S subunit
MSQSKKITPQLRFPEFRDSGGWEEKTLGEVSVIERGRSRHRPRDASFLYGGKFPFIQTGDIKKAELYLHEYSQTYSEKGLQQSKLWNEGTLCITIAANIAETAILKIKACFPDSIIGLVPKKDRSDVLFIKYLLDKFKWQIQNISQGVAQDNLNQQKLAIVKFPFPELLEQQKIAACLSSLDGVIAARGQRLALLQAHKKGLVQRLFPQAGERVPRLRFPEFRDSGEWEEKKVGDIYDFKVTNSLSRENLNYERGKVKNIHYGDIHTKFNVLFDITKELVPFINLNVSIDKIKQESYCLEGDMIFADASEDLNDIGKSIEIVNLNNERIVSGLHTLLARQKKARLTIGFGGYLFQSGPVKQQIQKEAQGAKVLGISAGRICNVEISYPKCFQEQQKIAACLSALDGLIAAEAASLAQLKLHKKGLMQGLFPQAGG